MTKSEVDLRQQQSDGMQDENGRPSPIFLSGNEGDERKEIPEKGDGRY